MIIFQLEKVITSTKEHPFISPSSSLLLLYLILLYCNLQEYLYDYTQ